MSDSFEEVGQRSVRSAGAKTATKAMSKGLLSLVPGGGLAVELLNGLEETKRQREKAAIEAALNKLGLDFEALKAKLNNDEELASIWERGLAAIRSARLERHRFAYVGILANAVYAAHDDRLEAKVLLRLLDQLDEEHLLLISVIDAESAQPAEPLRDGSSGPQGVTAERLKAKVPQLARVLEILISTLLATNIIKDTLRGTHAGTGGEERYVLTTSGRSLIKILISEAPVTQDDLS